MKGDCACEELAIESRTTILPPFFSHMGTPCTVQLVRDKIIYFFGYFFIRKFNTTKSNQFRMYLPKSDISDFGTEKILENYKPENVKIGYFRRKTVYFRSLLKLFKVLPMPRS